jgi:hypothetical protein
MRAGQEAEESGAYKVPGVQEKVLTQETAAEVKELRQQRGLRGEERQGLYLKNDT